MLDEPRLKARLRVQAMLRQGQAAGSFGAVVRHGDDEAGAIVLLLRTPDNRMAVLSDARAPDGTPAFVRSAVGSAGDDALVAPDEAASYVERAVRRDPDLWVVEFDADAGGTPPFPARIL